MEDPRYPSRDDSDGGLGWRIPAACPRRPPPALLSITAHAARSRRWRRAGGRWAGGAARQPSRGAASSGVRIRGVEWGLRGRGVQAAARPDSAWQLRQHQHCSTGPVEGQDCLLSPRSPRTRQHRPGLG